MVNYIDSLGDEVKPIQTLTYASVAEAHNGKIDSSKNMEVFHTKSRLAASGDIYSNYLS